MNEKSLLDSVKHIHFIGIGGSGMCPMAEILISHGFIISGSDNSVSDTLERIKRTYDIQIYNTHDEKNLNGVELVVYSAAIKENNPERVGAKKLGIPQVERSVMLGWIIERYKNSIAVSGTHGKTTTTSMITTVFKDCGMNPSAIIGAMLPSIGSNALVGKSDIMVCEACEYVDTFLQLYPMVSVILNIDCDHLDYFKTLENIIKSFHQFAEQTSGTIIVNGDDKNSLKALEGIQNKTIITYGFNDNNIYCAKNIKPTKGVHEHFDVFKNGKMLCNVTLGVPGRHNIYNALATFAAADLFGIDINKAAQSLHNFKGAHRRFEILGDFNGITVADDFAHHPTELKATLSAAKAMGFNNVWAVFQPHTYSRTAMLLDEFAEALKIPEHAVVSEILPVRETNTYNIYAEDLVKKIPGAVYRKTFEEITDYVVHMAKPGDLILTLGGGNVYRCAHMIVDTLNR